MSAPVDKRSNGASVIQQIILSPGDSDYLDQLIPVIKGATTNKRAPLLQKGLLQYAEQRETEIEKMCNQNHQEFLASVNKLQKVREGTVSLTSEILGLNQSIQFSTEKLAEHKGALVDSRGVRQNIDEASQALRDCLEVLRVANHVHELLGQKNHYGALRALDELQNVHLKEVTQYKLADLIQASVPATQKLIAEAVMSDLNSWLFQVRENSQVIGEVAFYYTEERRLRQRARQAEDPQLRDYKLNSAIELVYDEGKDPDIMEMDETKLDWAPLFECIHIHEALGQSEKFRSDYAATRRRQKDLILVPSITLLDEDQGYPSLVTLLEHIAGFAIMEKTTMRRTRDLRSPVEVDELWDSMCQAAIHVITKALTEVRNPATVLAVKKRLSDFAHTMEGWGYSVTAVEAFLLVIFEKYAELLKSQYSEDFEKIVSEDDYMPMPVGNEEEYDKIITVSWYMPDKPREGLTFPCVLPFSQMFPMCCINIRNFLNSFHAFLEDHFQHPNVVDETLKKSLDELLCNKVCVALIERLNSQYLGQIVQILTNLEHFENACKALEDMLIKFRSSTSAGGKIELNATEEFRNSRKTAEKRIFELVNSKIDDLIETAEYDWMAPTVAAEPSNYMQTLTRYLSNIMNSTLLGLPREIKELIYFDALSHAANMILALPLSPEVKNINPNGVAALAKDVDYLAQFVDSLENAPIKENLDELQQTVHLMQTDNAEEFYDISMRNKKYGRVDPLNGPRILEKLTYSVASPVVSDRLANFSSRFGMK